MKPCFVQLAFQHLVRIHLANNMDGKRESICLLRRWYVLYHDQTRFRSRCVATSLFLTRLLVFLPPGKWETAKASSCVLLRATGSGPFVSPRVLTLLIEVVVIKSTDPLGSSKVILYARRLFASTLKRCYVLLAYGANRSHDHLLFAENTVKPNP